jgi:acyl transferase domain-containing protein/NAD(P)H-dependent flavin oxidoreductase YrpB (nitropropane dioxygenase family)/NAD(P)-dependent dehydrogenase (short-subunit alcohol dehydrogenase family)/acyl carrier protein
MHLAPANQFFAFVWEPRNVSHTVVDLSRLTSSRAIFDLSAMQFSQMATALREAGATAVKISAHDFMGPEVEVFLEESGVKTLWVEYHSDLFPGAPDAFLEQLDNLSGKCACLPVISDLDLLHRIINHHGPVRTVALKGNEAAGFVSGETIGVLFSTAQEMLRQGSRELDLVIWGGVATPEAAAAFLATGAKEIVFESLHWQTDLVEIDDKLRKQIAKLRPEHTCIVGRTLGVCCRLFDKGNFPAVRELERYARSLSDGPITADQRRAFARHVVAAAVPALASDLDRRQLIPLGPEAAFAQTFVERFGAGSAEAIQGFQTEVARLLGNLKDTARRFLDSPAARELGTSYPFIQGAMTWISDVPEFALAVAEAGGLPTVALGLRNRHLLETDFSRLRRLMGSRPYAVNLIALAENPYLEEQLAWVEAVRPPFVAIAAGDPAYAVRLRDQGIEVIYITGDEGLLRLALEGGVRWLVLEGQEAGGHVGAHSSLTLPQMVLELKRREPELFQDRYLVLAGGIFNRATALRAAMLGADAIQMGTAYLATREIVSTGALSQLYQRVILDAAPGETALSGESIGLRVRSLKTPKMQAILALERKFVSGNEDESAFRRQLESLSARSLLIASRGKDQPAGSSMDEETCLKEGQFMSGAVAGMINRVSSIGELHQELAGGPEKKVVTKLSSSKAKAVRSASKTKNGRERVAITGMALVNSLGNTPAEIWENVLALKSGITEIPPSRWDHSVFYEPRPGTKEKTYCKVGAFHNVHISRKDLSIPPQDFRTMSNATKLTLYLANQAIQNAGIVDSNIPRERIGILISQNSGESASTLGDLFMGVTARKIVHSLQGLLHLSPEMAIEAEKHIKAGYITVDDTTLLGRLNSTAGGFISNKFGFMGPCYSVSAACATSLVAIYTAIQMINNGILDAAVVGGGEENLFPAHFIEFSALGALAGVSGLPCLPEASSRPFDSTRDGFVLGEGGGMIVIERESVAKKRGAHVYSYITGVGASNNDRGMVESVAETQKIAIRAGFEDAGYGPEMVDLVECHATATVQGDLEEIRALKSFYSNGRGIMLSSFKSQIGHCLGASGINNLVRGVMALQTGVFPPTLNYHTPDSDIDMERWGFHVAPQPEDWPKPADQPRRLQINAFGFGGANFVVHVEQCLNGTGVVLVPDSPRLPAGSEIPEEPAPSALIEGVSFLRTRISDLPHRLGVVAEDDNEAREKVASLAPITAPLPDKTLRGLAGHGIFAVPEADAPAPLALVFTGQGTYYPGMGRDLYENFPLVRQWIERVAAVADFDLLDLMFNSQDEDLQRTRWQQPALFTLEYAMVNQLIAVGVKPAAMAGHSMGEILALCVAGVFPWEDAFRIINKRAQCMDKAAGLSLDPGAMIAVDLPGEVLQRKLAQRLNVHITNFNSPRQIVLGGGTEEVLALKAELDQEGYWNAQLRVSMAFHSPIMAVIREEMAEFLATLELHPPQIPVISNTTEKPYPDDPGAIRRILLDHLENPVHWQQNVETLWHDYGVRTFVEVGPKNTLCNLIVDTFEPARCIHTSFPENEPHAFRAGVAQLYALGHVPPARPVVHVTLPQPAPTPAPRPIPVGLADHQAAAVMQREINTFILDTFGKYLKPAILEAIRREVDPSFSEARFEELFNTSLPAVPGLAAITPSSAAGAAVGVGLTPAAGDPSVLPPIPAEDYVERVIRIIMDATGYERDEIEPHMDIRQDLAIRSSRLPVIMDAAERHFGITITLEDFINVRTVQEIADRIASVRERDNARSAAAGSESDLPPATPVKTAPVTDTAGVTSEPDAIKRIVFHEVPLGDISANTLKLAPGQEIAVLCPSPGSTLAAAVADLLQQQLSVVPRILDLAGQFDLRSPEGAAKAAQHLATASLAGLVLVLDETANATIQDIEGIPALLTGFFGAMQQLVSSPHRKFCWLITRGAGDADPAAVVIEGVRGMFLDAALEYDSVLFRSVALDRDTNLETGLKHALTLDHSLAEIRFHGQEAFTVEGHVQPLPLTDLPDFALNPGDVVVISGGGKGITPHLAYALAPLKPRLVLLGRSELDPGVNYDSLIAADATPAGTTPHRRGGDPPKPSADQSDAATQLASGREITQTLKELARQGIEATYYSCDVNDPENVAAVLDRVVEQHGGIAGVIHGAGIIRDSFMEFMTAADFTQVVEVKLLGAWNLYRAAREHGLRFMVMLSSITAVRGNVGQINYCAGNRAMSTLTHLIASRQPAVRAKALMLPPIQGAGMADDPELLELMRLKGMGKSYISVAELAELFYRELFLASAHEHWVMPIRTLPPLKTVRLDLEEPPPVPGCITAAGVSYRDYELPMIQTIHHLEIGAGTLEAGRTFSLDHDLWMEDHRPFKFMKNPFVSGVMALETFMEAAHLLCPQIVPLGVRNVEYLDILECPPGVKREARIVCRRLQENGGGEVLCDVSLSCPHITPTGRVLDRWTTNYTGQVILGLSGQPLPDWPGFTVKPEELDSAQFDHEGVLRFYRKYSAFKERYRVLEALDGSGTGVIRGRTIVRQREDFAGLNGVRYQYSPYLLEALQHLVNSYLLLREEEVSAAMIPFGIGEMRFSRACRPGEELVLEGRRRSHNRGGATWDIRALDAAGHTIMTVTGLIMKSFSP